MTAKVFEKDEKNYLQWLKTNPDGYVLTTHRVISPTYMSLHRASCHKISVYQKNMASDAFTGGEYIKICSHSTNELTEWIKKNGGVGITKFCSICVPNSSERVDNEVENYYSKLAIEVEKSLGNDSKGRKSRLEVAPKIPETLTVTTTIFRRNPDVIAEVLERANGYCETCKAAAPFKRATNGSPYLEVHHKIPLADGGEDAVENAMALCPNCHRESHFGIQQA